MNQPGVNYDSPPGSTLAATWRNRRSPYLRQLNALLEAGLELLFPHRCAGCRRVDHVWCAECQSRLDAIPFHDRQVGVDAPFSDLAHSGRHEGLLRQALLGMKYENTPQLGGPLGCRMARLVEGLQWKVDLLVPVPLHPVRERERGYNQAQLIGQSLAQRLRIPLEANALRRSTNTMAQVGLSPRQRRENVSKAFVVNADLVRNRDLLLVDDVYTTGATLGECGRTLAGAGARSVYGLTLTRAVSRVSQDGGIREWT